MYEFGNADIRVFMIMESMLLVFKNLCKIRPFHVVTKVTDSK